MNIRYDISFQKNINFRNKCNILELRIQYAIWQPQDVEDISAQKENNKTKQEPSHTKRTKNIFQREKKERNYKIERKQQFGNKQKKP